MKRIRFSCNLLLNITLIQNDMPFTNKFNWMKKNVLLSLFILSFSFYALSQKPELSFDKFVDETQIGSSESGRITIAWWIPVEFWEITFQMDKSVSEEQAQEFINALRPYTLLAVVDGRIGAFGGITYTPFDSIKSSIVLEDRLKNESRPINQYELSPDIQNLISVFKPMFKNMMGKLGENMNFFVFHDKNGDDSRIFNPYLEGEMKVRFSNQEYTWRTPIGSLMPLKLCPEDNELLNGSWKYCPWHGTKLKDNNSN